MNSLPVPSDTMERRVLRPQQVSIPESPDQAAAFPCSPMQRNFWLVERLLPGTPTLNISVRWKIRGHIPPAVMQAAFSTLVERHPSLRTSFLEEDGEPLQIVNQKATARIQEADLTEMDEDEARAEVEKMGLIESRTAFELSDPPLIRMKQLRLRDSESIVLVTAHQLVCDETSMAIIAQEFAETCDSIQQHGHPVAAAAPPVHQDLGEVSETANDGGEARSEEFWIEALRGMSYFEMRPDRMRGPTRTRGVHLLSLPIEESLKEDLQKLSHRLCCASSTTVMAALFAMLHRYSGEKDIIIGHQLDGREDAQAKAAVGLFSRTILVRADLAADPTMEALIDQLREVVGSAMEHQKVSISRLTELLKPDRDASRNALFSVNYSFVSCGPVVEAREGFNLASTAVRRGGALYDLHFSMTDRDEAWTASCEYSGDLFDDETVSRMLDHFVNLLRAAAAQPKQEVSALPMIGDLERQNLVFGDNPIDIGYPKHLTVAQLFEIQARRTPDAIAVTCGEQSLSYRDLDLASNRVAHELQQTGMEMGARVGIFIERSLDLIVAIMAALKAGSAYVPMDPAYPSDRLAHILDDARPAALLTTRALTGALPDSASVIPRLCLDDPALLLQRDTPMDVGPGADDVAYVIYTSGSTGRPKGVQIQHGALTNLLWTMRVRPGFTELDTLVSVTTVSFDISVMDFLMPLIVGARLVVAKEEQTTDGAALLDLLRRHRATVMQATPATWQLLLEAGWHADPPLRILCGGEALSRTLADQLLKAADGARDAANREPAREVWNMYGPTEATVWAAALRVEPGTGPVAIGTPIANTHFYVLDPRGQLAPTGSAGELFIGGQGLALGYLNLPEMNRERFVPDHIRGGANARLYRTGDLVRRRSGGEIEFLGRSDHQIKLRGFRVELGEIESVLRAHPQVGDCVAVIATDSMGERSLRAYVVPAGPDTGSALMAPRELVAALRSGLRQALPAYMCPSLISVLEALPRTPNGKVDRAALPEPQIIPVDQAPASFASSTEERLSRIWTGVLGVSEVGTHENFFEIGGHSLLAVRLLARVESELGRKLPLAALFQHPTIAGQAALLDQQDERAFDFRQVVRLQPNGQRPPIIAINNTGIYYLLSKRLGGDQPFTSLQLFDPALPPAVLPETIEDIAAEYVQLILRVQGQGPYALLGWCVAGTLAFEVARQLKASGRSVSQLVLFDTWAPGHLRRLNWARSLLAQYAFRWKLIVADWKRAGPGLQGLARFLVNRRVIRKLMRWPAPAEESIVPLQSSKDSAEQYDRWLLRYLESAAASYQPGVYPGAMTLFRSEREPAGRFIDPLLGWAPFVTGGIRLEVVEGDHFSIFRDPSVARMARSIAAGMPVAG